jgi:ABC-type Fe3+-siderophore transport system permease subunit
MLQEQQTQTIEPQTFKKSLLPTRKWLAGFTTATAAFLVNWIRAGELTKEIKIALVGLAASAVVSYLVPNGMTPGGYPAKDQ